MSKVATETETENRQTEKHTVGVTPQLKIKRSRKLQTYWKSKVVQNTHWKSKVVQITYWKSKVVQTFIIHWNSNTSFDFQDALEF